LRREDFLSHLGREPRVAIKIIMLLCLPVRLAQRADRGIRSAAAAGSPGAPALRARIRFRLRGAYLAGTAREGDANRAIQSAIKQDGWKDTRAVLFLDPYGMEVEWKTLEAIAATGAIDPVFAFRTLSSSHATKWQHYCRQESSYR
jgi:hypothetical protein